MSKTTPGLHCGTTVKDRGGGEKHLTQINMNDLSASNKQLKSAHDRILQDMENVIASLDKRETLLTERVHELDRKKHKIAQAHGNLDVTDDDLVEINAGGKMIVAKRSTLNNYKAAAGWMPCSVDAGIRN